MKRHLPKLLLIVLPLLLVACEGVEGTVVGVGHVEDAPGWQGWVVAEVASDEDSAWQGSNVYVCTDDASLVPLGAHVTLTVESEDSGKWSLCNDTPWVSGYCKVWAAAGDEPDDCARLVWDQRR